MRYPPEKAPDPAAELPNPDLNPLLNPTLGRNLGRWAEVYFTSPPEKREEAVGELLRELKENPAPAATDSELAHSDLSLSEAGSAVAESSVFKQTSEVLTTTTSGVQCAECGHRHPVAQRFCGMCGAALATDELEDNGQQFVTVAQREPVFAQTSIFGFDTTPVTQPAFSNDADITWLREKNLAGEKSSGARKLIPAAVAMAAIGILIYSQSRPQKTQPSPAPAATAARPQVETAPQSIPSPSPPAQQTPAPAPPASQAAAAPTAPPSTPAPASANPAADANPVSETSVPSNVPAAKQTAPPEKTAAPEPTRERQPQASLAARAPSAKEQAAAANTAAGAEDLALATDYLNGRRGPRDSAEAAKFLWKAVGKENPSAILLLSDMYLVGDGVPKSCDQARLLLNAAVRKNVPQAAQKLRNLQSAGCP